MLLLKVHKDGPAKKDIWRAPGSQVQVRKLSHIMQHGRLVNIANFSVYTAASVIKVNFRDFSCTSSKKLSFGLACLLMFHICSLCKYSCL